MLKKIALLTMLTAAPAAVFAQQQSGPSTPEEVEEVRRAVAAMQAAEVPDAEDIETLRQRELDAEAARSAPGYANTAQFQMLTRRVDIISDGRGAPHRTQALTLAQGIISSVAFYDNTGQPWPVQSVAFDRQRISVNNDGCDGGGQPMESMGNVIVVAPCAYWTTTNMQVLLEGETRPIPFAVSSGTREEDIPVDGLLTVALQSDAPRPFGRDRLGNLDTSWVQPRSRTITIDPIDYNTGGVYQIFVTPGVTTDIAFMDAARNPWPVAEVAYAPGIVAVNDACDEESGGVRQVDMGGATSIYLTPCQSATATLAVRMEGRAGAMSFTIRPARFGQVQPDGTLSIVVPGSSPARGTLTAATAAGPGTASHRNTAGFNHDAFLDDFLFGTPPQGSVRASVGGSATPAEAWTFNGALYIRGAFTVINPAFDASAQARDGTLNVYKYGPPVSRILAADQQGRQFVLNIVQ